MRHIWRAGPALSFPAQEKHGHIEATLTEGHKYDMEIVVSFIHGEAERAVPVLLLKECYNVYKYMMREPKKREADSSQ